MRKGDEGKAAGVICDFIADHLHAASSALRGAFPCFSHRQRMVLLPCASSRAGSVPAGGAATRTRKPVIAETRGAAPGGILLTGVWDAYLDIRYHAKRAEGLEQDLLIYCRGQVTAVESLDGLRGGIRGALCHQQLCGRSQHGACVCKHVARHPWLAVKSAMWIIFLAAVYRLFWDRPV